MNTKFTTKLTLLAIGCCLLAKSAVAVDLMARYPTSLTAGDANPDHARAWSFDPGDVFRVSQFVFKVDAGFKVEMGPADLAIGHCPDGAVWAVLLPRGSGTLTSPVSGPGEAISQVWLRFHPARIDHLFPAETVFADGDTNVVLPVRAIARAKMTSSWQSAGKAMIPETKDLTVYVDTKDGTHRFFVVDTEAQTAEYIDAFNQHGDGQISSSSVPPVVVKTVPESGSTDVTPGEFKIRVTFSKEMMDGSWSWCEVWDNSTPEGLEAPSYEADHKTCTMKVKLEPGKAYGYWLNTETYRHFQDPQHRAAVPYLLTFKTGSGTVEATNPTTGAATQAAQAWLSLMDNGNYSNCWTGASAIVQGAITEAAWETSMNTFRKPLGVLVSRHLKSAQPMTEMPGAPDGQYVLMQFDTSFVNKKTAVETVTFKLEKDGSWRSAGYYIK